MYASVVAVCVERIAVGDVKPNCCFNLVFINGRIYFCGSTLWYTKVLIFKRVLKPIFFFDGAHLQK